MVLLETKRQQQHDEMSDLFRDYRLRTSIQDHDGIAKKVYGHVVRSIRNGIWTSGQKIVETQVAKEFGISHIPVREAMEKLQQEGWIDRIPNKGIHVKIFDKSTLEDLFQIREMVEVGSVRVLVDQVTEEQLHELKKVTDLCDSSRKSGNSEIMREADVHFHRLLVHYVSNPRLASMFESVLLQARGFFFSITDQPPFYAHKASALKSADHLHIFSAIANRDAKKAEKLTQEHIRVGCVSAIKLWELFNDVSNVEEQ